MKDVVLAIDDDPLVLDLVEHYLWEYDVRTARGGSEGLKLLGRMHPALILLDVNMPVLNGVQTLRRVRSEARLDDIRVMMLTGVSDRPTIAEAVRAGATGYMLKPFTGQTLRRRVKQVLASQPRIVRV